MTRLRSRPCYQCGNFRYHLSSRSRCELCEEARATYNEQENDELRERVSALRDALVWIENRCYRDEEVVRMVQRALASTAEPDSGAES